MDALLDMFSTDLGAAAAAPAAAMEQAKLVLQFVEQRSGGGGLRCGGCGSRVDLNFCALVGHCALGDSGCDGLQAPFLFPQPSL